MDTYCQECKKPHDFTKECFGSCSTCQKKDMCEKCCYNHECIPGKSRQLLIITNPAWVCNLRKIERPETPTSLKQWEENVIKEWGG